MSRPTSQPDRITRLALRTLQDVEAEAFNAVVELQWGHRLALAWLQQIGVAKPWQVRQFVEAITAPIDDPFRAEARHYVRGTLASGALRRWHVDLGLPDPDPPATLSKRYALEMLDPDSGRPQPWLMCNRYKPGERETIRSLFTAREWRQVNPGPSIVHPREPGWVIRRHEGELVMDQMSWGFPVVLRGTRGAPLKPKPVNNARFDKLGSFWSRWARNPENRCLIPATAYAEAEGPSGQMRTTWLRPKGLPMFAWAGLWTHSDEWGDVYTGVMTDAPPEQIQIHDRSPVILAPEDWQAWLEAPLPDLSRFDRPWSAAETEVTRTDVLWKDGGREAAYAGKLPAPPF